MFLLEMKAYINVGSGYPYIELQNSNKYIYFKLAMLATSNAYMKYYWYHNGRDYSSDHNLSNVSGVLCNILASITLYEYSQKSMPASNFETVNCDSLSHVYLLIEWHLTYIHRCFAF